MGLQSGNAEGANPEEVAASAGGRGGRGESETGGGGAMSAGGGGGGWGEAGRGGAPGLPGGCGGAASGVGAAGMIPAACCALCILHSSQTCVRHLKASAGHYISFIVCQSSHIHTITSHTSGLQQSSRLSLRPCRQEQLQQGDDDCRRKHAAAQNAVSPMAPEISDSIPEHCAPACCTAGMYAMGIAGSKVCPLLCQNADP